MEAVEEAAIKQAVAGQFLGQFDHLSVRQCDGVDKPQQRVAVMHRRQFATLQVNAGKQSVGRIFRANEIGMDFQPVE